MWDTFWAFIDAIRLIKRIKELEEDNLKMHKAMAELQADFKTLQSALRHAGGQH